MEKREEGLRWVLACEDVKKLGCLAAPMVAVILYTSCFCNDGWPPG